MSDRKGKDAGPFGVEEVLRAELDALRPGTDKSGSGRPLSALCLSGGGIRSATFALGVLQGLADRGLLRQFDYLSTVSGGGYIGSWLTAWKHRCGGMGKVEPQLRSGYRKMAGNGPDPIAHLRSYNSYLSPRVGLLSGDTWTLVATVLRNMLLNWMVILPLLLIAILIPRLYLSLLTLPELLFGDVIHATSFPNFRHPDLNVIGHSWIVTRGMPLLALSAYTMVLYNTLRFLPGIGGMDHTRADYTRKILLPSIIAVLTFIMMESLYFVGDHCLPSIHSSVDNCEGPLDLATLLLAWFLPGLLAWLGYRFWAKRHRPRNRVSGRSILVAFLFMAGLGALALWAATYLFLPYTGWGGYVAVGPPTVLLGFILGSNLFVGMSSRQLDDADREWMARNVAGLLMFAAIWALLCWLVLVVPGWVLEWQSWAPHALTVIGAVAAFASAFGDSPAPPGSLRSDERSSLTKLKDLALSIAPVVFIAVLLIGLSLFANAVIVEAFRLPFTDLFEAKWLAPEVLKVDDPGLFGVYHEPVRWNEHAQVLERTSPGLLLELLVFLFAAGWASSRFININKFSLSGMYRQRLIRAYLGASNPKRDASRFTGFDADDDLPMHELDPAQRPLHVVNLTLNLVGSGRLAWQQRKAASFTVTPLHAGTSDLGYRTASWYGGRHGISLGTAVAISGAAASPNMGANTTPAIGFVMTLLNARLGAWLGNPSNVGTRTWRRSGPKNAIRPLIDEALGRTDADNEYIYLSDGGHFENLGLYEMVKRRCRHIVVVDAGCDPDYQYDDLGNALRKIRIDFGVQIDFDDELARPLRERTHRCSVGRIRYSETDLGSTDGWLIYIKPMVLGNEVPDVLNYHKGHPKFPHETTSNQWFNESQTESYRVLGLETVEQIFRGWSGNRLDELCGHVQSYLTEEPLPPVEFSPYEDPDAPAVDTEPPLSGGTLAFKPRLDATAWPDNVPGGSFDFRDLDERSLKVAITKWLFANPQWWMGILRRWWPVPRLPGGRTILTRFDHVKEALEQQSIFQVPFGERMREMLGGPNFVLGMQDGPTYQVQKSQIMRAFRDEDVARVVLPHSRDFAEQIVENSGGRIDAIASLITRVPTLICESYYGVNVPDRQAFAEWAMAMSAYMFSPPGKRPGFAATAFAASKNFRPVLEAAIRDCKQQDPSVRADTLLSRLVAMQEAGEAELTDDVIRAHLSGMITGFVPTNSLAAGNVLEVLLKRPDVMAQTTAAALADDDDLLQRCLFEAMRFRPINPGPFRSVHEDYMLCEGTDEERLVKGGTRVMVSTQSAMFDERRVENPRSFDPDRDRHDYLLFGHGLHWCIGASLAEAQITQTFKPLLRQRNLRRARGRAGRMVRRSLFPAHLFMEFDL